MVSKNAPQLRALPTSHPERRLQTILDERGQRDLWVEIEVMAGYCEHWMDQVAGLADACRVARVHRESHAMMMRIFEPMAQRINHLHGQVFEKRKTGIYDSKHI